MKKTLQQQAKEQGVTRQTIWLRTPKGRVYGRVYRKTPKYKAYRRAYQRAYYQRIHVPVAKLRELGLIT